MAGFTRFCTGEYQFNGETIKVTFKRMSRIDAMTIAPYLETMQDGNLRVSFKDNLEFVGHAAGIIDRCVTSLSGLKADNADVALGSDVWKEDVLNGVHFMPLIRDIMGDIMAASFVNGDDAKKPAKKPEDGLTA